MKTITAVITVKEGAEDAVRAALLKVAEHVAANEPDTIGFFVSQAGRVFTTYERFVDQAAMDLHNGSAATAAFFEVAKPVLDGDVVLVIADEASFK